MGVGNHYLTSLGGLWDLVNIMAVKNYKLLNKSKILVSENYISYFEVIKNIYSFLPVVVIGGSVDVGWRSYSAL